MAVSNPILEGFGPYNTANGDGFFSNGPLWLFPGSGRPGISQGAGYKYMQQGGGGSGGTGAQTRYTRRPQTIPVRYACLNCRLNITNYSFSFGNSLNGARLRMVGPDGEFTVGFERSSTAGFMAIWYSATNSGNAERQQTLVQVPASTFNYYEMIYDYLTHSIRWRLNRREQTPVALPAIPMGDDYTSTSLELQFGFGTLNSGAFLQVRDIFAFNDPPGGAGGFLGDFIIEYYRPDSDELPQDWTPNGVASGFQALDNDPANTAEYIEATAAAQQSQFGFTIDGSTIVSVGAVAVQYTGRKTDAAVGDCQSTLISNGTPQAGTDFPMPDTTYQQNYDPYPTNPDGGGDWTPASMELLEVLITRTA